MIFDIKIGIFKIVYMENFYVEQIKDFHRSPSNDNEFCIRQGTGRSRKSSGRWKNTKRISQALWWRIEGELGSDL